MALAVHRYLFTNGFADEAFLREHTRGADRLRERAAPWTIERAAERVRHRTRRRSSRSRGCTPSARPRSIRCGWGLERNRNGGNAAMAVLVAAGRRRQVRRARRRLLDEQLGVVEHRAPVDRRQRARHASGQHEPPRPCADRVRRTRRSTCCSSTTATPSRPSPISTASSGGCEREDLFTVVFDQVMTDTALYADVVLPATTFLEGYDFAQGVRADSHEAGTTGRSTPSASRGRMPTCSAIWRRGSTCSSDGRADRRTRSPREGARRAARHDGRGFARGRAADGAVWTGAGPVRRRVPEHAGSQGRICSPPSTNRRAPMGLYAFQPDPATDKFPLALISPASERTISSTLGAAAAAGREAADASRRCGGARAGRRGSRAGSSTIWARCTARCRWRRRIRPGTVSLPKGLWRRSTRNGTTGTALVPDTLTDIAGGACFNDARVQVASLPTA